MAINEYSTRQNEQSPIPQIYKCEQLLLRPRTISDNSGERGHKVVDQPFLTASKRTTQSACDLPPSAPRSGERLPTMTKWRQKALVGFCSSPGLQFLPLIIYSTICIWINSRFHSHVQRVKQVPGAIHQFRSFTRATAGLYERIYTRKGASGMDEGEHMLWIIVSCLQL